MTALTLLESAKAAENPVQRALYQELSLGELSGLIPFENTPGPGVFYNKVAKLPQVAFRGTNEVNDPDYGIINPQSEAYKMMQADIDVDLFQLRTEGPEARINQITMQMESMRFLLEDRFINGDEAVNNREFDGLRKRINVGSSQAINASGALSLAALDELNDATDALGGRKVFIMNQQVGRRIAAAARNNGLSGLYTTDLNEFGRRARFYDGVEIVTTKVNGQNLPIQPFTENANGIDPTGGATTSIYCVAFGPNLVTMHQGRMQDGTFGPTLRPLGEQGDGVVDRTRFEWDILMTIKNGRSASRLYGVTNAAVVA